jgi:serine/threonine protein kinase
MAEVWAARVEGPGGFVKSLALKFILESFTGDADLERLFLNEARVAARLQHPNLVSVFDFDKVIDIDAGGVGRYYIAMERVEGHDLRRVLQVSRHKGRRMPPEIALHIAAEVARGLRYVHERRDDSSQRPLGLVHRDVSPHNVLVGMDGQVKLSDFGIAKAMTQSLGTQSGMIRGKLAYASPEQLRSEPVDHRADQFGLGVTLWEMLADRRLFDGADEMEIVARVLRCEIPPLPEDLANNPALEGLVRRMLAGRARDRFASTSEVLAAVLSTSGYVADADGLVELMQNLFATRAITVPPTVPLSLGDPPLVGGSLAETRQIESGASPPLPSPLPSPLVAPAGLVAKGAAPAPGKVRDADWRGVAGKPSEKSAVAARDGIPTRIEPAETLSEASYVSGEPPRPPTSVGRGTVSGRPTRVVWVLAVAALAVVGGITVVGRRDPRGDPRREERSAARAHSVILDGVRQSERNPGREAVTAAPGSPVDRGREPAVVNQTSAPTSAQTNQQRDQPPSALQPTDRDVGASVSPPGDHPSTAGSRPSGKRPRHPADRSRGTASSFSGQGGETGATIRGPSLRIEPANGAPLLE